MPEVTAEQKTEATAGTTATPPSTTGIKFDAATHVPEPLRSEAHWKSFEGKDLGDVLKSGLEAHKMVGSSVRVPAADAKPEEWDAFYAKSRPADISAYKIPFTPEFARQHAPEGFTKDIIKAFHEVGLMPRQADHILKAYENTTLARSVNDQRELGLLSETAKVKIKETYGANYDKAAAVASRAAKRFGGDAMEKLIKDYQLDSDPVFFKAFYDIGSAFAEDTWVGGEKHSGQPLTKDSARDQIKAIYADKTHPYHDPQAANHSGAVEEVNRLRKVQYA